MRVLIAVSGLFAVACSTVYVDPDQSLQPRDAPSDSSITDGRKTVFTTSITYEGELLGGLEGADAKCATRATAAALSGDYRAWLSVPTTSAASRLTHSTDAYVLVDGTEVSASWAGLVGGTLLHAIDLDENGHPTASVTAGCPEGAATAVWTATLLDGTSDPTEVPCNDWTVNEQGLDGDGLVGNAQASDSTWTNSDCANSCDEMAALYCIEQ